jgi:very-short-patch-repair endonuclease
LVKRERTLIQTALARGLHQQPTDAERYIWNMLRNAQLKEAKFRRQHPLGNYIVDFVSLSTKLIIEVDGGQHNDDINISKDVKRQEWLEKEGYRVLRFWNNDVLQNPDGVFAVIH